MEEDRGKEEKHQGRRTKYMRDSSAPHDWFFSCSVDMVIYYRGDSPYIVFARISKDVY